MADKRLNTDDITDVVFAIDKERSISHSDDVTDEKIGAWASYAQNNDFVCKVYQEGANGHLKGKQQLCFAFSPVDYTASEIEEKCLAEFGGGRYWIKGYEKNKLRINENFFVASPRSIDKAQQVIQHTDTGNSNSELMMYMAKLQQDSADARAAEKAESRAQLIDMMKLVIPVVAPVLIPLLFQKKETVDPIDMIVKWKQLEGDKKDGVEMLLEGIKLANELGGGVDKEENIHGLLGNLLNTFGKPAAEIISAQARSQNIQPRPQNNPAPKGLPSMGNNLNVSESEKAIMEKHQQLKNNVIKLVQLASVGMDTVSVANLIETMTPPDDLEQILVFLECDTWFEGLLVINPDVENHKEWFTALRAEFIEFDDENLTDAENTDINTEIVSNAAKKEIDHSTDNSRVESE